MFNNTPNQLSKFRTRNWVEVNDDVRGMYNSNSEIKFKTLMLKSSACDYSDAYILVSRTITVAGAIAKDRNNKQVIFKYCARFTDCITEISNV